MDTVDSDLVRRAQEELPYRTTAFEQLAASRYPEVRRLARAITGSTDAADTVAQDAMLRVYHGLTGLRDPSTFDAWLRRIVANVARSHVAHEARERRKAERLHRLQPAAGTAPEGTGEATASADFDTLVAGLRLEERTVLAFRLVAELPYPEIADILGISESGAKMRYRRAISRLRTRLRDEC